MQAVLQITEGSLKGLTTRGSGGGNKKVTTLARNLWKMRRTSHLGSPAYAGAWRSFIMSFGLSSTSAPVGTSISGRSSVGGNPRLGAAGLDRTIGAGSANGGHGPDGTSQVNG